MNLLKKYEKNVPVLGALLGFFIVLFIYTFVMACAYSSPLIASALTIEGAAIVYICVKLDQT